MTHTQSVALIGAGVMGRHYATALDNSPDAQLTAVCDIDEGRAQAIAEDREASAYTGFDAMLAQQAPDAVIVATPDFAHTDPVIASLSAGNAVLCEKPLATTRQDCSRIVAARKAADVPLMVNYGNRHRSNVRKVRQIVAGGELGDIQHIAIRLNERLAKTKQLSWLDRTSPVWFLLSHCVDTVQWIAGDRITSVNARAQYGTVTEIADGVPDVCVAMGEFSAGATVILESAWHLPEGFYPDIDFSAEIIGTDGAIHADFFAHDLQVFGPDRGRAEDYTFSVTLPSGKIAGWWFESVRYFLHCLRAGQSPEPDAEDAAYVTGVLGAIDESIGGGATVRVEAP